MASLTIRKLPEDVYARLRERARQNNRSLEAEAREILEARTRDLGGLVEELKAFQAEMTERYGTLPDSTPVIRSLRSE
jgi:plasmid stability protein